MGGQVTTLTDSSESGTGDGAGAVGRFIESWRLTLDERGRLLVAEFGRKDTLRVVEASLAPPPWMGPVEEAAQDSGATMATKTQSKLALENYDKILEDGILADVVLVVDGERFPAHRVILAAQSEYFRGLFLSGMQEGRSEGGVQEIELGEVSAGALRVVLWYLYTAELPESAERGGGEEAKGGRVLERAVLKAADLFRVEGLLEHCVEAFGRGLKVDTAVEQLVWAHNHGPAEARTVATEYFARNGRRIQVDGM